MVGVEYEVLACVCWLTEDFEVEGSVRLSEDECMNGNCPFVSSSVVNVMLRCWLFRCANSSF